MGTGTIIDIALWAALVPCALIALSGYVHAARTDRASRDFGCWCGPLAFTSASFALAAAAGLLGLLSAAVLMLVPLAVIAWKARRVWREAAKTRLGKGRATVLVLKIVADRAQDSLRNALGDVRDLLGTARRPVLSAGEAAPSRKDFAEGLLAATRHVPPLQEDDRLGGAPGADEVAGSLDAAGTGVPPVFAALAAYVGDFDPDGDEDEMIGFAAGCAAGSLALGEAFEDLTESLLNDLGLDPAFAVGFFDVAEGATDLAGVFALLVRRYREVYGDIHEHVDAGGTLPHDARGWFHADDGGGAAA